MKSFAVMSLLFLAATAAQGSEDVGDIPVEVVSLLKGHEFRYVNTFECSAGGCGHHHFVQRIAFDSEVACTRRITEITLEQATAYPVWKDTPEALYLTVIDVSQSTSSIATIVPDEDCSYRFSIEPLTRESDLKARHSAEG